MDILLSLGLGLLLLGGGIFSARELYGCIYKGYGEKEYQTYKEEWGGIWYRTRPFHLGKRAHIVVYEIEVFIAMIAGIFAGLVFIIIGLREFISQL